METDIESQLKELTEIAQQIQLRSFSTPEKQGFVKYPKILRDQLDEYFKKYPYKRDLEERIML